MPGNDGSVTIKTQLDNSDIPKGVDSLKDSLRKVPKEAKKAADQVEKELTKIDVSNVEKNISEPFQEGAEDIKVAIDSASESTQDNADEMAEAMDDAADRIRRESDYMSDSVKDDLDDIGDEARKTGQEVEKGLGVGFKELLGANLLSEAASDGLREIGETAVEVGKQAVEAAAAVNASNAQFKQTFKGVERVAKDSLNAVAKQAGMTATRMQDSYTSIFAFSKSVGADQAQALDIASRAMAAAADSAAYYDKSVEEATETLQSFLKGNYENDAALGIAATETTRNAKANELYAKSFQKLSEAQKVDVLLAMVEAGNEASGALGQAARESDSWVNVTGELNEAWRLLLATMGDPFLENLLIPVIQEIISGIQKLIDTTASSELTEGLDGFQKSIDGINESFEAESHAIEKNAVMAQLYADRLSELEKEGFDPVSAAGREYANVVDALNSIYPELNLQIDEQTGLLNSNSKAQLSNLEAMKKKALFAAQEKRISAALEAQADAILNVQAAEKALTDAQTERKAIVEQITQATGLEADELIRLYGNQTNAAAGYVEMSDAAVTLTDEQMSLVQQILSLNAEETRLKQGIEEGTAALDEHNAKVNELADSLGIVTEAEKETAAATDETAAAQEELAKRFQDTKESAMESLNSQIGLFTELELKSNTSAEKIVANWQKQQEAFANYAQNLQTAINMGLDEVLVQQLADGSQESMIYLNELVNGSKASVEQINAEFQNLTAAKEVAASAMAGVKEGITVELQGVSDSITQTLTEAGTGATTAMEGVAQTIQVSFTQPVQEDIETLGGKIEDTFENAANTLRESWSDKAGWFESNVEIPINSSVESIGSAMLSTLADMESENDAAWRRMVQAVENAIDDMQKEINSLKGKTVDVGTSSTSYSETSYTPAAASAAPIGIPMLATGAVIPPNAPFFAVLGDQTNGRNLEAPEALIRQIIQEEIGEIVIKNEISFAGELAPLARILYPEILSEAQRVGKNLAEEVIM